MFKVLRQRIIAAKRRHDAGRSLLTRAKLAVVGGLAALSVAVGFAVPGPAAAESGSCSWGLNTATTAWGHCTEVGTSGYLDGFRLVVNCYSYWQQISYGTAGQSISPAARVGRM